MEKRSSAVEAPYAGGSRVLEAGGISKIAATVVLLAVLTAMAGQVRVPLPFTPVPLTLQLIPVLLAGAILGPVRGSLSQMILLAAGGVGMPVFSGAGAGPSHLLGPTGGYLIGFVAAAWLVGRIVHRPGRPGPVTLLLAMTSGAAVVHLIGIIHLAAYMGGSPVLAFKLGSLPFLLGDLLKVIAAVSFMAAWPPGRTSNA